MRGVWFELAEACVGSQDGGRRENVCSCLLVPSRGESCEVVFSSPPAENGGRRRSRSECEGTPIHFADVILLFRTRNWVLNKVEGVCLFPRLTHPETLKLLYILLAHHRASGSSLNSSITHFFSTSF